ncbi:MAG: histidine kinase [Clostridiales bacterium]|nr:histidine kinase [Clostridiales bacterium]
MFSKLRRLHTKMMLRQKLLLINMVVAILPVVIFAILITRVYEDTVNLRTRQSVEDASLIIGDRITRVLKDTENCSNYLTVNINKVMDGLGPSQTIMLAEQKAIINELYVAQIVFDEVDSIAFISKDMQVFASDNTLQINKAELQASWHLEKLQGTSGKSIWFPCEARKFLVQDTTIPVLTLGKKVVQIHTGETLGFLFLNVDISVIESNLVNQLINYRLVDENNMLISSVLSSKHIKTSDVDNLLDDNLVNEETKYQGRNYYISSYKLTEYGWNLIGITDLDEFNVDSNKIFHLVLFIAIAVILFEFVLSNYLSRIITAPLMKLKNGAEEIASGNMKLRFRFKSEDEIGQLGSSFNYMTEQVEELLAKVDYEARKKREYELSLLHEQVKPHFLYNSLDIVLKLSEMNRHVEARRAVKHLADYYKNSLSDSKEIVTIKQEIKIVEDYLELQMIRYRDLFHYSIMVDDSMLDNLIPKLTLQPIIENAIYHGLKCKEGEGEIHVMGMKEDNLLRFVIKDNGVGITSEGCDKILHNKPEGGFGLYSVNHRIKLIFGEEYGVTILSQLGEGTEVEILMPAIECMGEE